MIVFFHISEDGSEIELKHCASSKTSVKGTVSPAEGCDFVGVKLEKVHELFQVCRICGKGVVFYNMVNTAYYTTKVSVIHTQSSIYIN